MKLGNEAVADRAAVMRAAASLERERQLTLLPYVAAVFLGAALIFSLEPMVGKQVLPRLGGAPAVWNTCLLFFQAMLLAGYAYAHYGLRKLGMKWHTLLHHVLIVLSLIALIAIPPGDVAEPPLDRSPIGWLLLTLFRSVGLPFFVLSATAPLVQSWLAGSGHPAGRDPYFLYAASNFGSLTGLSLYPFVLEPLLGLRAQAGLWAAVYVVFGALLTALAWRAHRSGEAEAPAREVRVARVPARTAVRWVGIAFLPSALLLTVTDYVTTDIAPMPLLWLAPLALYLMTFIIAFGARPGRGAGALRVLQPAVTLILATAVLGGFSKLWLLPLHLFGLTLVA